MRRWIALFAVFALLRASTAWAAYFPEPIPVVGGGTGLATLTAHAVMVGAGTGNVALVGPGSTAGVALVSGGSSADPSFTTVVVAGGGTGLGTLTTHNVLLGEGTGNVAFAAPGATVGVPLISQNATTDPVFGTAVVAGGGTGLGTLTAHAVILGEGTGNVAFVSPQVDSVVAWAGSASADPAALAVNNCATALTYSTGSHAFGCNASSGTVPTIATATGGTPIAIAATNELTTIISMASPAASVINLPTAVQTAGWRECVKDGTTDFGTNNATLKSPTSGTIDGTAGATGILMNIKHMELCVMTDGTNWFIE